MTSVSQCFLLAGFFAIVAFVEPVPSLFAERSLASRTLAIHVYNYSRLSKVQLDRAEKASAEVFQRAGLETVWVECPVKEIGRAKFQNRPNEAGPKDLILKIIPKFDSKREGFTDSLFGFAAGFQVTIVCDRVEETAKNSECPPSKILGLMIAHEIGHALLGPDSHSPTGIMRPLWRADDFRMATRQSLRFEDEQVAQIHSNLSKRAVSGK
jgi:hypothetical protein